MLIFCIFAEVVFHKCQNISTAKKRVRNILAFIKTKGVLSEWVPWVHYCGTPLNLHVEDPVLHSGIHKLKLLMGPLNYFSKKTKNKEIELQICKFAEPVICR